MVWVDGRIPPRQQSVEPGRTGAASGVFNESSVATKNAQPRTPNALKTAWLEVRQFVTSLFGSHVTTDRAAARVPSSASSPTSSNPSVAIGGSSQTGQDARSWSIADNRKMNEPFGQARSDWVVETMNKSFRPLRDVPEKDLAAYPVFGGTGAVRQVAFMRDEMEAAQRGMEPAPVRDGDGLVVAQFFKEDMEKAHTVTFNGSSVPGTEGGGETGVEERLKTFGYALREKGLDYNDILLISRIMNHGTTGLKGVIERQYIERPDLAPNLKLPDGEQIPVSMAHFAYEGAWNIEATEKGFDITYKLADRNIDGIPMPGLSDELFFFGDRSSISIDLTFKLERTDGDLKLVDMGPSAVQLTGCDEREPDRRLV